MDTADTLKTATIGISGSAIGWLEIAGPYLSALGALATLVYMSIKIYKELTRWVLIKIQNQEVVS